MSSLIRGLNVTFEPGSLRAYVSSPLVALTLMVDFNLKAFGEGVEYKEGDVIGVVQFRNMSLEVEHSNPVNKDFENLINSDDDELFGAFPKWFRP